MNWKIPLVDMQAQHAEIKADLDAALERVLASQQFIMGPEVSRFEAELAAYAGVPFAVGCASGTDALQLALMALGIGPGAEIITTPFTFAATVEVIVLLGAVPVYADIDLDSYNIRVDQIEDLITPRTKAILPVHLYGQPVDLDELKAISRKYGIPIIEDGAQALGAYYKGQKVCGIGAIGCTSFFPAKNLGAYGDAGGVFTADPELADRLNKLHTHGSGKRYRHELVGLNSRIDALQAAVLRVKLPHLDRWNQARQTAADWYRTHLNPEWVVPATCRRDRTHIYQQFTIRTPDRDRLQVHLAEQGIPSAVHYPTPLFQQPAFRDATWDSRCPAAQLAAAQVLSLPMHPYLSEDTLETIVDGIHSFFK